MQGRRTGPLVLLTVVPLLLASTGCGKEAEEKAARAKALAACPTGINGQTPSQQLPADFPGLSDARIYRYESQGKTRIWYGSVSGGSGDVEAVRDRVVDALKRNGYEIEDTDAEKGVEAEAGFKGPHEGTVRARPLCKDRLEVRYKLES